MKVLIAFAIVNLVAVSASAQVTQPTLGACVDFDATVPAVTSVGTFADDRQRIAQDLGRCSTDGELIRSARSLTASLFANDSLRGVRKWQRCPLAPCAWAGVLPSIDVTHNSNLPFSMNDGPEWAGRGITTTLSGGLRFETNRISLSVSPNLVYQQNLVFQVLNSSIYFPTPRSPFASVFHSGLWSIDLPSRFGSRSQMIIYPGESWLDIGTGPVAFGFSTDEQWWGPGIRNALVMSNNAPGVPQLYLRSRHPLATPIGDFEFRWLIGDLTESLYFDAASWDDSRSLSAAVVTLRPAFDRGLTLGLARSVYAPASSAMDVVPNAFDVFTRWNQSSDTTSNPAHPSDQLLSLFGRWVFPSVGLEAYLEWTKLFPPGLRELLVDPQSHDAYTAGLQWVDKLSSETAMRLQMEFTTLEQTPPSVRAIIPSFYTSRFVPQGYTQRGQVIGAAIGPGSSSQFLAGDYFGSWWRAGLEFGRIRWDDDSYYRSPNGFGYNSHDVSLFAGVRGGTAVRGFDIDLEAIAAKRYNYLFQSPVGGYTPNPAFDLGNFTFRFRVAPR